MESADLSDLHARLRATSHLDEIRAASSPVSTRSGTCTWITRARASIRHRSSRTTWPSSVSRCSATRIRSTRRPGRMTELVEQARAAVLRHCRRRPRRVRLHLHRQRHAARCAWSGSPSRSDGGGPSCSPPTTTTRSTASASSPAGRRARHVPARHGAELRLAGRARSRPRLARARGLFAFPAQSNFSGVQHPWRWWTRRRRAGWRSWSTPRPTPRPTRCDLSARASRLRLALVLQDVRVPDGGRCAAGPAGGAGPSCGGRGSPAARSASPRWRPTATAWAGPRGFEDGTLDFLSLPAVTGGLAVPDGADRIDVSTHRVTVLTELAAHAADRPAPQNGAPLVRVARTRRPTPTGRHHRLRPARPGRRGDCTTVASSSWPRPAGISLRTGCFCNPGAGETARDVSAHDLAPFLAEGANGVAVRDRRCGPGRPGTPGSARCGSRSDCRRTPPTPERSWTSCRDCWTRPTDELGLVPPPPPLGPDSA